MPVTSVLQLDTVRGFASVAVIAHDRFVACAVIDGAGMSGTAAAPSIWNLDDAAEGVRSRPSVIRAGVAEFGEVVG